MTKVIRDRALAHNSFCALFDGVANKRLVIEEMFIDPLNPAEDRCEYRMYMRQVFNPMAGSEGNSRSVNEAWDGYEPDFSAHIDELAHDLLNRKILAIKSERTPQTVDGWDEIKLLVRANPDFTSNPHSLNEATCSKCFDATNRANSLEKRAILAEADREDWYRWHGEATDQLNELQGDSLVDQICKAIDNWRARVDPDVRVSEIWSAFEEIADKLNEGVKEHAGPKLAVNNLASHVFDEVFDSIRALREQAGRSDPREVPDNIGEVLAETMKDIVVDDPRYSDEDPTPAERAAADAWQANHELGTSPGKIPPRPFLPKREVETDRDFRDLVLSAAKAFHTIPTMAYLNAINLAGGAYLDALGAEYDLKRHGTLTPVYPADLMLAATQPVVFGFDRARDGSDHSCTTTFRVNEAGGLDLLDTEFHAGPEPIRPRDEQPMVHAVVNADQPELWDLYRLACEDFNREPSKVLAWKVTAAFRRWGEAFCKTPFPGMTVEQSINQMVARLTGELLAKTSGHLDGGDHAEA